MSTDQIVRLLRGRRCGKDKWMAKCSSHDDRQASLSIVRREKGRTSVKCFSGCSTEQIMESAGLRVKDLFEDEGPSADIRKRLYQEAQLAKLEKREALAMFAQVIHPEKRKYWQAAERRIREERRELTFILFPERKKAYDVQKRIRDVGWEAMWATVKEEDHETPAVSADLP